MKIAVLSPISWRTPPRHYGPWEQMASNICEGLIKIGQDVTLFATSDSLTRGKLEAVCPSPLEEDKNLDAKVWESLHISRLMEMADKFDIIHNNYDFLPLTYSGLIKTPLITTIHGFSSPRILEVYRKYDATTYYVSISDSDRDPDLHYCGTVYNGIDMNDFSFRDKNEEYLLFFGRIHHDKGCYEAIQIARRSGRKLIISGIIQDQEYFQEKVKPCIDNDTVRYVGSSAPVERNRLLGGAFALLHPINFDEPFGLSVAEAMICGTPVIAFNRGSMPELIVQGKTGFLVNSVDEAVSSLQKVRRISRQDCRNWSMEKFTTERMARNYLNLYQKILSGSIAPASS